MSEPIGIGVIGMGFMGQTHARAYLDAASTGSPCELRAVCDRDPDRRTGLATGTGNIRAGESGDHLFDPNLVRGYADPEELFADPTVGLVSICTHTDTHVDLAIRALDAGKHVLVEKPLATTVTDAREMVEAAEAAGVKFMVDFHARWHPLFMGAKGYAESGQLGDPVMAYARLSNTLYVPTEMLRWSGDSGPEWFLFPHVMDVVRWILDSEPVEVFARGHRGVLEKRGLDCWDAIQALVEFENGAICTFETSWILPNSYTNVVDNRLSLAGSKGGLEIKNEPNLWAFTDRFHTPFSSESVTRYGRAWGFQYESIRYFVDCVAKDVTPEAGGRDGLVVTAMIEATLKSLRERRSVRMDELLG